MHYIRLVLIVLTALVSTLTYAEEATTDESLNSGGFDVLQGVKQLEDQANSYGIVIPPGYLDGPMQDDVAYKALSYILGMPVAKATMYLNNDLSESSSMGEFTTPLTQMLGLVSGIALVVGAILMAFILWAGLTKTSVEGDFLGKKWDSYWLPIRITGSLSSLAPFPGFGGLSLVQVGVLVLVLLAIGMGSTLWSWFLGASTSQPIVPVPSFASTQYFNKMLKANACARYLHWYDEEKYGQIKLESVKINNESAGIVGAKFVISANHKTLIMNRATGQYSEMQGQCGSFMITYNVAHASDELNNNQLDVSSDKLQDFIKAHFTKVFLFGASNNDPNYSAGPATNLKKTWDVATEINEYILVNSLLGPSSGDYDIDTPTDLYNKEVKRLQALFWTEMNSPVFKEKIATINEAAVEKGKRGGFFMAGPYYTVIRNIQTNFNNGLTSLFNEINGSFIVNERLNIFGSSNKARADYQNFANEYDKTIIGASNNATTFSNSFELTAEDIMKSEASIFGVGASVGQAMFKMLRGDRLGDGEGSAGTVMHDPMMEFQSIGQKIAIINFTVSSGITAARIGAAAIEGGSESWIAKAVTLGTSGILGKALRQSVESLWEMWSKVMTIMFGIELLYTVVLPTMPLVMWIVGCLGYLIYVVEALVASPFWMVMHSHPDGDEVFGRGASGYPIVMTIVLYPSLMVLGLAAGMQIVHAMGWVTWTIALPAITATLGDSAFMLTSLLGVILIYGMLVLALIYKSFSLVHELPNSILQWMGVGSHFANLGEKDAMNSIGAMKSEGVGVLAAMAAQNQLQGGSDDDTPSKPGDDDDPNNPNNPNNNADGDNVQSNLGNSESENKNKDAEKNFNNPSSDNKSRGAGGRKQSSTPMGMKSGVGEVSQYSGPEQAPLATHLEDGNTTPNSMGTSSPVVASSPVDASSTSSPANNSTADIPKSSSGQSSSAQSSSAQVGFGNASDDPNNSMDDIVKVDDPTVSAPSTNNESSAPLVEQNSISDDSGPLLEPKDKD
jgi:conjugal transfer/type IV secretion protein DotA/TraY